MGPLNYQQATNYKLQTLFFSIYLFCVCAFVCIFHLSLQVFFIVSFIAVHALYTVSVKAEITVYK